MCRKMGTISEVQITLPAGFGAFVRVRVALNVKKKLERFVSVTRAGAKDWYQIKYEKMPTFCNFCGLIGHWYEECGTGEHDPSKFEWGDFILADEWKPKGGRGRGSGAHGGPRGGGRGRSMFGRGGGRGSNPDTENYIHKSWRWNAKDLQKEEEDLRKEPEESPPGLDDVNMKDIANMGKKRPAINSNASNALEDNIEGAIVVARNNSKVADIVGIFDEPKEKEPLGTPQKNANKKKLKGKDGGAIDNSNSGSAASLEDDRRDQ